MAPKKSNPRPSQKSTQQPKRPRMKYAKNAGPSSASVPVPPGLKVEHQPAYQQFHQKKVIKPNGILDWDVLKEYGLVPAMRRLLQDPAWLRLFSLQETAYKVTTLAFLASFSIEKRNIGRMLKFRVNFYAFGAYHSISMRKFIKATGLYTKEEMNDPEFNKLPILMPSGVTIEEVWRSISREKVFRPSRTKASTMIWTSHRVFHYILAKTLNSKMDTAGTVTKEDILPLTSAIRSYKVNVGVLVAYSIQRQAGSKMNGIYVGQMITRILKNLKLWPKSSSQKPKDGVAQSKGITHAPFQQWGTAKVDDPCFDAEAPGAQPQLASHSSFSVGNLAHLEADVAVIKADVAEIKKNQNIIINLLTKLAEHAGLAISSCFSGASRPEQPSEDLPSTSAPPVPQEDLPSIPEQVDPLADLDLEALKVGETYESSEAESSGDEEMEEGGEEEEGETDDEEESDDEEEEDVQIHF